MRSLILFATILLAMPVAQPMSAQSSGFDCSRETKRTGSAIQ